MRTAEHNTKISRKPIKNTVIYAGIYGASIGMFVLLVVLLGQVVFYGPKTLDARFIWLGIFTLLVVAFAVRPLDRIMMAITDKFLFQKKFEYQETLKEVAKGMASVTDINKLFKLIVYFITLRIRITHADLFYFDEKMNRFIVKANRGADKVAKTTRIPRTSSLIGWLEEKKDILAAKELDGWLKHEQLFPQKTVLRRSLEEIKTEISKLKATLCVPCFIKEKLAGFLVLGDKLSGDVYTADDIEMLAMLSHEAAAAIENAQLYEELYEKMAQIQRMYEKERKLFVSTAIAFANAIDAKDAYTHGHIERVTKYCLAIGQQLRKMQAIRLEDNFEESLHLSALLHDVGKIGTPDEILNKKGPLTKNEYEEIKKHSAIGASILYPIKELSQIARAIRHHQERYDGKGYPDGLKGEDIPLESRIIMVADTFDAMITDRPYRTRVMDEVALKEIEQGAATQFDPIVVEAFIQSYKRGDIVRIKDTAQAVSVADVYINDKLVNNDNANGNNNNNQNNINGFLK